MTKNTIDNAPSVAAERIEPQPRARARLAKPALSNWGLTGRSHPKAGWLGYLTLILLTLVAFSPMLQSDLLWTDYEMIERTSFQNLNTMSEAWRISSIRGDDPISLASYFLEQRLPVNTHRLINICLHLLAAVLLLRALESLRVPGAFSASAIFALHPAALQTLFWPGYRTEVLAAVLVMAAVYFAAQASTSRNFVLMFALSLLAFLIHPGTVVLPFVIGALIILQNRTPSIQQFNRALPIFCMALFVGVWTATGRVSGEVELSSDISKISVMGQNLFFYLTQTFLPIDQALFHPFGGKQGFNVGTSNNLLLFIIFIPFYILIFINFKKVWARGLFFGLTTFLLFSIYSLTQLGRSVDGAPAHETRLFYLALPWLLSTAVCGLSYAMLRSSNFGKAVWKIGLCLLLIAQFALTASFAHTISDPIRLWKSMSEKWPESPAPVAAYLDAIYDHAPETIRADKRIELFNFVLEKEPNLHLHRQRLARLFREEGQNTNAVREYKQVLRDSEPDNAFLEEAATFFDSLGLRWDAQNTRERIAL